MPLDEGIGIPASGSPWGNAIGFGAAFTATGQTYDSVPASVALIGSDVIAVGGNRNTTSVATPWRCAIVALSTASGNPDTSFGTIGISSGVNSQGISIFSSNTSNDCILNSVVRPPSGSNVLVVGTAYNGTNYDYLSAALDSSGTLTNTYGNGGIKTQMGGGADDVLNAAIYLGGSTTSLYAVGRSLSSNLYNGGSTAKFATADGSFAAYTRNNWTQMSTTGAPSPREFQGMVWTGSKVIIWGGSNGTSALGDGAMYDPSTDTWTTMATTGAPSARAFSSMVWTGTKAIVFGGSSTKTNGSCDGSNLADGAVFDPNNGPNGTWSSMSSTGAPGARSQHTAAWTGTKMLVYGGCNGAFSAWSDLYAYDPASDTWTQLLSTTGFWTTSISFVWTGTKLITWNGSGSSGGAGNGRAYDPANNTWSTMSTVNNPFGASGRVSVWTGSNMVTYAGQVDAGAGVSTALFDPTFNSWTSASTTNAAGRWAIRQSAQWTGSKMVVWGGDISVGIYDPVANTWVKGSTTGALSSRFYPMSVWTGLRYIEWGGDSGSGTFYGTGALYTPP